MRTGPPGTPPTWWRSRPGRTCPRDRFWVRPRVSRVQRPGQRGHRNGSSVRAADPTISAGPAAAGPALMDRQPRPIHDNRPLAHARQDSKPRVVRRSSSPQSEQSVSRALPSSRTGDLRRGRAVRRLPNAVPVPWRAERPSVRRGHDRRNAALTAPRMTDRGNRRQSRSPESQCNRPITEWRASMPFVKVGTENSADIEIYYEDHGAGWTRPASACPA
jgi:hypothetical protein